MVGADRVFTDVELAERWQTTKRAVQDMARDPERIQGFKVGREWRFHESVVLAYETGPRISVVREFSSRRRRAA